VTEFPAAKWKVLVPSDGVYGGYYCQAINATAPHPFTARLWQEFLYSDQGQILWLKGYAHPARFTDLAGRKVIPKALLAKLPSAAIYNKVKFASLVQISKAAAQIKAEWPSKVG
jgi:putative spermidine/putrescine transport system substrate-binding protein